MRTNEAPAPVLRVETVVRGRRADGTMATAAETAEAAQVFGAAFVLRWLAPPRRARDYATRPLARRLRAGRTAEAFGLVSEGTAEKKAKEENRL